jgi:hypothetical protein
MRANFIAVLIVIITTATAEAQDSSPKFAIQLSTGSYPAIQRIVYKSDPPHYGPALPHFRYIGCIATPGVAYQWKQNILALGIRTYLPQPKLIRTGAELSYEWIHQRPAKKLDHTFGGSLVYNYYRNNGSFHYGTPFYYTEVENDFILMATAGLRKTYTSGIFLFGTSGAGILVPTSSLKVSDSRRYFSSPPHSLKIDKPTGNIMLKVGIGYSL